MSELNENAFALLKFFAKAENDNDYFELDFKTDKKSIDPDDKLLKLLIEKGFINGEIKYGIMGAFEIILKGKYLTNKGKSILNNN